MWYYFSKDNELIHVHDTLEDAVKAKVKGDSQIMYSNNLSKSVGEHKRTIVNHTDMSLTVHG